MKKIFFLFILCVAAIPALAPAQILIENFRNFDCANCKIPDENFESFLNDHPDYKAVIIYYHNRDPFPFDPFFLAAKDDILSRNTFYTVAGNPTVHVSGYYAGSGSTSLENWKTYATDASQISSPAVTEILKTYNGDSTFTITLNITGSSVGAEVRPYVLLTESGLIEPNSKGYGIPSSGFWDHIFRDSLAPSANGGAFVLQGSKTVTFTLDTRGRSWKWENLQAIAFLQSTTMMAPKSFPVIGISSTPLGFFASVKGEDVLRAGNAYPNPFSESVSIPFSLAKSAHVTIRISDLLGREVATVLDRNVGGQESSAMFNPQSLAPGTYVASIFVDGLLAVTQKLIYHP